MKQPASRKTQKEKFLAAAQGLEGSEKAFNAALKRIGSAKAAPRKSKVKKPA